MIDTFSFSVSFRSIIVSTILFTTCVFSDKASNVVTRPLLSGVSKTWIKYSGLLFFASYTYAHFINFRFCNQYLPLYFYSTKYLFIIFCRCRSPSTYSELISTLFKISLCSCLGGTGAGILKKFNIIKNQYIFFMNITEKLTHDASWNYTKQHLLLLFRQRRRVCNAGSSLHLCIGTPPSIFQTFARSDTLFSLIY